MGDFLKLGRCLLAQAAVNASETGTAKYRATTSGLVTASSGMLIMSVVSIILGSFSAAQQQKHRRQNGQKIVTLSTRYAMTLPLIASCVLYGLYSVLKFLGKERFNMLFTLYYVPVGIFVLASAVSVILRRIISGDLINDKEHQTCTDNPEVNLAILYSELDRIDILSAMVAIAFGGWYLLEKHWIANNLFGLAFAHHGITQLNLNSVATGCILSSGLFVYDVLWVFRTDVMVTVATGLDAPMKLEFPVDLLENGVLAKHFSILGLGDIVVPGLFIALLLRYDLSKGTDSKLYFTFSLAAYTLGLVITQVVATVFKHGQPALLYLVPLCVGVPLFVALLKGEIKPLLLYRDAPDEVQPQTIMQGTSGHQDNSVKEGEATGSRAKEE